MALKINVANVSSGALKADRALWYTDDGALVDEAPTKVGAIVVASAPGKTIHKVVVDKLNLVSDEDGKVQMAKPDPDDKDDDVKSSKPTNDKQANPPQNKQATPKAKPKGKDKNK